MFAGQVGLPINGKKGEKSHIFNEMSPSQSWSCIPIIEQINTDQLLN